MYRKFYLVIVSAADHQKHIRLEANGNPQTLLQRGSIQENSIQRSGKNMFPI